MRASAGGPPHSLTDGPRAARTTQRFRAIVTRRRRTRARRVRSFTDDLRVPPGLRVLAQRSQHAHRSVRTGAVLASVARMPSGAGPRVGLVCSAALAIAATTACGSSPTSPSAPGGGGVLLSVVSQPGEEIGRGQTHRFTLENASFAATTSTDRAQVFVDIREQSGIRWHLELAAAPGTPLAPGSYSVNESVSPYFRTGPYLAFYGNGLGCAPVGRFTVRRVTYGGPNMLSELDATFEQRCPGSTAGLSGEVRIVDAASDGGSVPDISGAWSGSSKQRRSVVFKSVSCRRVRQ